jgi:hypothetical protein
MSGLTFAVEFRIHVEKDGWHSWLPGNEITFDSGVGKRLEAIQFRFPNGISPGAVLVARAHVQYLDWMPYVNFATGDRLGTPGGSLRLEAIQMAVGTNEKDLIELMEKQWIEWKAAHLGPVWAPPGWNPQYDPRYPYGKDHPTPTPGIPIKIF